MMESIPTGLITIGDHAFGTQPIEDPDAAR